MLRPTQKHTHKNTHTDAMLPCVGWRQLPSCIPLAPLPRVSLSSPPPPHVYHGERRGSWRPKRPRGFYLVFYLFIYVKLYMLFCPKRPRGIHLLFCFISILYLHICCPKRSRVMTYVALVLCVAIRYRHTLTLLYLYLYVCVYVCIYVCVTHMCYVLIRPPIQMYIYMYIFQMLSPRFQLYIYI